MRRLAMVVWLLSAVHVSRILAAETAGIGAALGKKGDDFIVRHILPDSPAAAHRGIGVGDRLLTVGNDKEPAVNVKGRKLEEVVGLVRGPKGSTVRLTIVPAGKDDSQAKVISLVRGELKALARWGDGVRLVAGSKAPDITWVGLATDRRERLSDHAGKIIVLEFWATWCGPCQKQVADLQELLTRHTDWERKVLLVTASIDEVKVDAVDHLKRMGWNKTHNVWVEEDAVKAFHVDSLPTTYLIDAAGNVLVADPEASIEEVLAKLLSRE